MTMSFAHLDIWLNEIGRRVSRLFVVRYVGEKRETFAIETTIGEEKVTQIGIADE